MKITATPNGFSHQIGDDLFTHGRAMDEKRGEIADIVRHVDPFYHENHMKSATLIDTGLELVYLRDGATPFALVQAGHIQYIGEIGSLIIPLPASSTNEVGLKFNSAQALGPCKDDVTALGLPHDVSTELIVDRSSVKMASDEVLIALSKAKIWAIEETPNKKMYEIIDTRRLCENMGVYNQYRFDGNVLGTSVTPKLLGLGSIGFQNALQEMAGIQPYVRKRALEEVAELE